MLVDHTKKERGEKLLKMLTQAAMIGGWYRDGLVYDTGEEVGSAGEGGARGCPGGREREAGKAAGIQACRRANRRRE